MYYSIFYIYVFNGKSESMDKNRTSHAARIHSGRRRSQQHTYKNIRHYSSDDYIEALRSTLLVLAVNVLIPAMIANEEI
jgi:hypothetical protein